MADPPVAGAELVGGADELLGGIDELLGGDDELLVPELPHPAAKAATAVAAAAMAAARFIAFFFPLEPPAASGR